MERGAPKSAKTKVRAQTLCLFASQEYRSIILKNKKELEYRCLLLCTSIQNGLTPGRLHMFPSLFSEWTDPTTHGCPGRSCGLCTASVVS